MERKFGRLRSFDERSRNHRILSLVRGLEPLNKLWKLSRLLDQLTTSACVGHGISHEILCEPVVGVVDHNYAMMLYNEAKKVDEWPGEDYDGTSVLAGMKVAKKLGWYESYDWAFTLEEIILAVSHVGPVVMGTNWYEGMETPEPHTGLVKPTGWNLGGHCWIINGNNLGGFFDCSNSWGTSWGINGTFRITHEDLWYLMEHGGECCLPSGRKNTLVTGMCSKIKTAIGGYL